MKTLQSYRIARGNHTGSTGASKHKDSVHSESASWKCPKYDEMPFYVGIQFYYDYYDENDVKNYNCDDVNVQFSDYYGDENSTSIGLECDFEYDDGSPNLYFSMYYGNEICFDNDVTHIAALTTITNHTKDPMFNMKFMNYNKNINPGDRKNITKSVYVE